MGTTLQPESLCTSALPTMLFTTRTIVSAVSALAALAGSSLAQDSGPIINAPLTVYTCQPAAITFSGGTAPYYISVLPGGATGGERLETFPTQSSSGRYTWNVDLAAGQNVTLAIVDSTGVSNFSGQIPILQGASTDCLSGGGSSGSTSAPSAPTSSMASTSMASSSMGSSSAMSTSSMMSSSSSMMPSSTSTTMMSSTMMSSTMTETSATESPTSAGGENAAGSLMINVAALIGGAAVAVMAA